MGGAWWEFPATFTAWVVALVALARIQGTGSAAYRLLYLLGGPVEWVARRFGVDNP
jgi:hypothetical protein